MDHANLRICLLSDNTLDRAAYAALLRQLGLTVEMDCALDARSVWSALRCNPDVMIASVDGVSGGALDCVQMVTRLNHNVRVILLTNAQDASSLQLWATCRIDGYVLRLRGVDELLAAIRAVHGGDTYFSPPLRDALKAARARGARRPPALSPRERELLPLLARGMTLREAALSMSVSYKTADAHRTHLMRKLGVRSRIELARYAIRERIIDP